MFIILVSLIPNDMFFLDYRSRCAERGHLGTVMCLRSTLYYYLYT